MPFEPLSRRTFIAGLGTMAATCALFPEFAFAVTSAEKQAEADAVRAQLVPLQADLETASEAYYGALAEEEAAQTAMDEAQVQIDSTTAQIEDLQDKLAARATEMYTNGSTNVLDLLLGAATFQEFTNNWYILDRWNQQDNKLIGDVKVKREELAQAKEEFEKQKEIAHAKAEEAADIKAEVEAKINVATELMNSLDAEARQLLEEEQAAEAARQAAEAAAAAAAAAAQVGMAGVVATGSASYHPVPSYGSVVDYAMSRIGCPYVWGAGGPEAFDCSGLVQWAYAQVGVSLPHQSESLYATATNRVPVSEARPGDVLYRPGHVGIAVSSGGTTYVHAPTFGGLVRDTDSLAWSGFTCALQFS